MDFSIAGRSLVCVVPDLRKQLIAIDDLTTELKAILPGEEPERVLIDNPPEAPLIITFVRAGFQVTAVDHKVTVVSRAPEHAKAAARFAELASTVLRACREQSLSAFGFNVDFVFEGEPVADVLKVREDIRAVQDWRLMQSMGRFVYTREGYPRLTIDVSDVDGESRKKSAHVNVHHEVSCTTVELASQISGRYDDAIRYATEVVKGVIGVE